MKFFDTNVLVYAVTQQDPARQKIAAALVQQATSAGEFAISAQVLHEFFNVLTNKFKPPIAREKALALLSMLAAQHVEPHTAQSALAATQVQDELQGSWWDALLIEAALRVKASVLYTEDLQHGRVIRKRLKIINPFAAK